jgi:hypothetical protein
LWAIEIMYSVGPRLEVADGVVDGEEMIMMIRRLRIRERPLILGRRIGAGRGMQAKGVGALAFWLGRSEARLRDIWRAVEGEGDKCSQRFLVVVDGVEAMMVVGLQGRAQVGVLRVREAVLGMRVRVLVRRLEDKCLQTQDIEFGVHEEMVAFLIGIF